MSLSLPTHHDESSVAARDVDLNHLDFDDLVGVAHDEKAARLAAVRALARPVLVLALAGAHRHAFWKLNKAHNLFLALWPLHRPLCGHSGMWSNTMQAFVFEVSISVNYSTYELAL